MISIKTEKSMKMREGKGGGNISCHMPTREMWWDSFPSPERKKGVVYIGEAHQYLVKGLKYRVLDCLGGFYTLKYLGEGWWDSNKMIIGVDEHSLNGRQGILL